MKEYPVLSFVLGILAGAFVSALGLYLAHRELDKERQKEKIKGLYQALYEELKEIQNAYNMDVTIHWESVEKNRERIFRSNVSLTQDYSTIYHASANLIGQVPNSKLRRRIAKTYTSLNVLIDYYRQNNRALDEHDRLEEESKERSFEITPGAFALGKKLVESKSMLASFTQLLQKRHRRFLRLNEILLKTLKKELSKTNERFWEQ